MENAQRKRTSPVKIIVLGLSIGFVLTGWGIVVGKKTHFSPCDYSGRSTNVVDRGAPLPYFKVTPSESTCVSVDYTAAVFASDVGNDISFKALFADLAIWSGLSIAMLYGYRKIKTQKA
ncbi:MAG TPA: hypothetical protein VJ843_01520 [Candidatus Saccharimonadales bacterium]|nr:hypothetical protein [Candidatus Saccharimonadales bacterium]